MSQTKDASINFFFEGVNYDHAPDKIKATQAREMVNANVIHIDGETFIITSEKGNDLDINAGIGFQLTDGFMPIGHDVRNGIAYILSHNPVTGEGEIGTFPSPEYDINGDFVQFQRIYRPLDNYLGGVNPYFLFHLYIEVANDKDLYNLNVDAARITFTTSLFNFDFEHMAEVKLKTCSDGSLNIYFADAKNPTRVINSGFNHLTGERTEKLYSQLMFEQQIWWQNETLKPPQIAVDNVTGLDKVIVQENGKFSCGTVYLYFRYATDTFDVTSFVEECGPIAIFDGSDNIPIQIQGGAGDKQTNKSIKITLETATLDYSYKFLEIAYIRYFDNEQREVKLIGKRYSIMELATVLNGEIEITGYEPMIMLTEEEVTSQKRKDDIVFSLDIADETLFLGHTKEEFVDMQILRKFALGIDIDYNPIILDYDIPQNDDTAYMKNFDGNIQVPLDKLTFKNYQHIYHFTGYFSTEAYAYGCVALLKNGKKTSVFPCTGKDSLGIDAGTNTKGIFRFPDYVTEPITVDGNADGFIDGIKQLGVKFTINPSAVTSDEWEWLQDNVVGLWFTRTLRQPNLLYQGLMVQAFNSEFGFLPNPEDEWLTFNDPANPNSLIDGVSAGELSHKAYPERHANNRIQNGTKRASPFIWQFRSWRDSPPFDEGWLRAIVPYKLRLLDKQGVGDFFGDGFYWGQFFADSIAAVLRGPVISEFSSLPGWQGILFVNGGITNIPKVATYSDWARYLMHFTVTNIKYGNYGFFSPDWLFANKFDDSTYTIRPVGRYYPKRKTVGFNQKAVVNQILMQPALIDWQSGIIDGSFIANAWGLREWDAYGKHGFVSYYSEGKGPKYAQNPDNSNAWEFETGSWDENHLFYGSSSKGNDTRLSNIANLEMGISAYIGINNIKENYGMIHTTLNNDGNVFNFVISNIYFREYENLDKLDELYLPELSLYHKISKFIKPFNVNYGDAVATEHDCFKGDCFTQMTYIKTLFNPVYSPDKKEDGDNFPLIAELNFSVNQDKNAVIEGGWCGLKYGNILGLITQQKHNSGLRHSDAANKPEKSDQETFYPLHFPNRPEEYAFEVKAKESYRYNYGYDRQLSSIAFAGFDYKDTERKKEYGTRIVFTARNNPSSITDNFRISANNNHFDYETKLGDIYQLLARNNQLLSFHYSGIIQHMVNERTAIPDNTGAPLTIAEQKSTLHPKGNILSESVGIQARRHAFKTENAFYFFDHVKRLIGGVGVSESPVDSLSDKKYVQKWVIDTVEINNTFSDIANKIYDKPIDIDIEALGISWGYNKKYSNVYITFNARKLVVEEGEGEPETTVVDNGRTIVYNEKTQSFIGKRHTVSPYYLTINEDFFSVDSQTMDQSKETLFYLHDIHPLCCNYYGAQYPFSVSYVANKDYMLNKWFEFIELIVNDLVLNSVEYRTQYQAATHSPFLSNNIAEAYIQPEYLEGKWMFAIKRASTVQAGNNKFEQDSVFTNQYLEVTLSWLTALLASGNEVKLQSALTFFDKSSL